MKCTVVGIYDLRRIQIKLSGRLDPRAVLALDCCPSITPNAQNAHPQVSTLNSFHKDLCLNTYNKVQALEPNVLTFGANLEPKSKNRHPRYLERRF